MLIPPVTFIYHFFLLNNHTHLVEILFYSPPFEAFFLSKFKHLFLNAISVQVKSILSNIPGITHPVRIVIEAFSKYIQLSMRSSVLLFCSIKNDPFSEGKS